MGVSLNPSTILSGQGIDVSSVVSQIIGEQSGQLTIWQGQQTTLATQEGLLEGEENNLTSLQTAVAALADPTGALAAQAATSSDSSVLTATAQTNAVTATHSIVVNNLATTGTLYTDPIADGPNASILANGETTGDIQLQVGGSGNTPFDIPITQGSNDTLTTLAAYINTQSTANNWGVTASIVSDTSGSRLALFSQSSGTAGALAITTNTTTGAENTANTEDLASAGTSILPAGQTTGTIQLQLGGSGGTTENLAITAGSNDTLNTLANYINTQSTANSWGVTATVVNDAGGYHLSISSSASGTPGDVAFGTNTTNLIPIANLNFDTPVGGTNASLTIDGVPFTSSSNIVTGAIQGVTLSLVGQSPGTPPETVQLTVGPDQNQITNAVNNFVSAYNSVVSTINSQYVVDPTGTIPAPPLESDISLRSLQTSMLTDASYAIGGNSGLVNLASLGINMNNDGTLTVGSNASGETFADVLATNPTAVQSFFQNSGGTGFANNFNTDLTNLTAPASGPLNVDLAQDQAEGTDLGTTITNFQTNLTTQTAALTAQYDSVNASLQSYPLLLQEITETLGTLGSGTSASGALVSSEPTLTSGL
ncbi:MAG: flagellar filament capping protein FliD [Candidatus Sulfotelmatobacter sp.]